MHMSVVGQGAVLGTRPIVPKVRRRFTFYTKEKVWGLIFIAPFMLAFLTFTFIPYVMAIWLSVVRWKPRGVTTFAGLQNFKDVLEMSRFHKAVINSFYYALMVVPTNILVSITIAVLIISAKSENLPKVFQAIFYLPGVIGGIAVSVVWRFMFDNENGLLNYLLSLLKIARLNWLGTTQSAMPSIALMAIVGGGGFQIIIFCAALLGIPQTLYDAAEVDGASFWRKHLAVTLPLLTPALLYVMVVSTMGALQVFTPMFVLTKGGPAYSTMTVGYFIYNELMFYNNADTAAAAGLILLFLTIGFTILQFRRFSEVVEA